MASDSRYDSNAVEKRSATLYRVIDQLGKTRLGSRLWSPERFARPFQKQKLVKAIIFAKAVHLTPATNNYSISGNLTNTDITFSPTKPSKIPNSTPKSMGTLLRNHVSDESRCSLLLSMVFRDT